MIGYLIVILLIVLICELKKDQTLTKAQRTIGEEGKKRIPVSQ